MGGIILFSVSETRTNEEEEIGELVHFAVGTGTEFLFPSVPRLPFQ